MVKVNLTISSVQFSCSVMSNSLRPHDCSSPGFPVHHQLLEPTQTLCSPDPRRKEELTTQETDPDMPRSVQKSPEVSGGGVDWQWPAAGLEALSAVVHTWDLLKEVPLSSLSPPSFGLRPSSREGTQPHPSTESWIKDLQNMPPAIRTRPSFPLPQSLPSGSFHKPLILLQQRAYSRKTTITGN